MKIDIVIPCYNESKQISNVIETMPEFVDYLVIIDDASTDNTLEIIDQFTLIIILL